MTITTADSTITLSSFNQVLASPGVTYPHTASRYTPRRSLVRGTAVGVQGFFAAGLAPNELRGSLLHKCPRSFLSIFAFKSGPADIPFHNEWRF